MSDTSKAAMRALEDLTAGGSEYVGDVARCTAYIKWRQSSQHEVIVKLTKRLHVIEKRDKLARELAEAVIKTVPGPDRKGDPVPMLVKKARQLLKLYEEEKP